MNEVKRVGFHIGLLLLVPVAPGCGRGIPPTMEMDDAKAAVAAALDAWQGGATPATLRERSPPIDFRDVKWDRGSKLNQYDVEKQERSGVSVKVTVKQKVTETAGAWSTRVVVYNVDAGPVIVIRPDSLEFE